MKRLAFAMFLVVTGASTATADTFVPVKEEGTFRALIDGKLLRNYLYGVRLNVLGTGEIKGEAWGYPITGTWNWQDGYFCREMAWGDRPIPYNCQLVETREGERLRFTVDRGAGDSAVFRVQ